jgi:hypothetical protein
MTARGTPLGEVVRQGSQQVDVARTTGLGREDVDRARPTRTAKLSVATAPIPRSVIDPTDRTPTIPSEAGGSVPATMSVPTDSLRVCNDELATVREAMRELHRLLEALETGQLEKIVLTQKNQMRAVLVSVERYAELQQRQAAA